MENQEPSTGADSSVLAGGSFSAASVLNRFAIVHGVDAAHLVWERAAKGSSLDNPSSDQLRQSIRLFLEQTTVAMLAEHEDLGSCEITSEPLPIPET
jgi:hypothetical protein